MCGCSENGESTFASDIKYDGKKITCNGSTVKPCDDLSTVIQTLAKMFCKPVVLYSEEKNAGGGTPVPLVLASTTYTVPTGGEGDYEIMYSYEVVIALSGALHVGSTEVSLYKNGVVYNSDTTRHINMQDATSVASDELTASGIYFVSNVTLAAGDVIDLRGLASTNATINQAVCKITKIKRL